MSTNLTRDEAERRASRLRAHGYQVLIDLSGRAPSDPETTFVSTSTVRFSSSGGADHIDLIADRLIAAELDGVALPVDSLVGHRINFEVGPGEHELKVSALCRYSHTGEGLHRFVDPVDELVYCYSQLETADARRMYACFEQPDLKATFTLSVIAPVGWTVLSNSAPVLPTALEDGLARWEFATTPPLPTYITALIAGDFLTVHDSYQGKAGQIPLSLSCRQSLATYLDSDRLFAVTKAGFAVYEEHFGLPYPFADYAQVFVPEFNSGAMENAGCVTIRDEYLYRSRVTNAAYEARDNTILHELAHMWFGDLVTMTWWDDLWLNESFAEWASHFCQAEIREKTGNGDDPWATFTNNRKNWAYRADQLPSTHPVAADMVDLEAVELNFDGITYAKGASVLRQLVAQVGEDAFLAGVRTYFARHAWGNTSFDDLLTALQESSGRDLSGFAADWLRTAGVNTLRPEFEVDSEGRFSSFAILQDAAAEHPRLRRHRLGVGLYDDQQGKLARVHHIEVDLVGARTQVPELVGRKRPALLLLNDLDLSYAKLRLDPVSMETVVRRIRDIPDALTRALCWGASWDMCRDAELPAADYLDLVLGGVGTETDLTAVGAVLANTRTAIDYYSPRNQRHLLNRRFLAGLAGLLKNAAPGSDHQLAFARALAQAADGPAVEVLQAWLSGIEVPAGLVIDTDLRWLILMNLSRLGIAGEAEIQAELVRDATAQGRERAAGARAASPSPESKQESWRLATSELDIHNETHFQICANFWQFDQDQTLQPYVDRYRVLAESISAGADGWDERSSAIKQHALRMLFPAPLLDASALATFQDWAGRAELTPAVLRQVSERIADVERALRCQGMLDPEKPAEPRTSRPGLFGRLRRRATRS